MGTFEACFRFDGGSRPLLGLGVVAATDGLRSSARSKTWIFHDSMYFLLEGLGLSLWALGCPLNLLEGASVYGSRKGFLQGFYK